MRVLIFCIQGLGEDDFGASSDPLVTVGAGAIVPHSLGTCLTQYTVVTRLHQDHPRILFTLGTEDRYSLSNRLCVWCVCVWCGVCG